MPPLEQNGLRSVSGDTTRGRNHLLHRVNAFPHKQRGFRKIRRHDRHQRQKHSRDTPQRNRIDKRAARARSRNRIVHHRNAAPASIRAMISALFSSASAPIRYASIAVSSSARICAAINSGLIAANACTPRASCAGNGGDHAHRTDAQLRKHLRIQPQADGMVRLARPDRTNDCSYCLLRTRESSTRPMLAQPTPHLLT